jgi:hypothetical protein
MSLERKPTGLFNKGLRKVQAAQAEARSLAIRDYAVRARAAVDALEQSSDEGTLGARPPLPSRTTSPSGSTMGITVTRARYRHAPVATRRATQPARASGSAAGRGRGVNRAPPDVRGVIGSTRKVRQSPRPVSNATRYQRRPQFTSWHGSASRSLTAPRGTGS